MSTMAARHKRLRAVIVITGFLLVLAVSILWVRHDNLTDIAGGPAEISLAVSSASFANGGWLPKKFTCDGPGVSPALAWSEPPWGTKSLVILADDLDAPIGFVHWIVFNLPPNLLAVPEGTPAQNLRLNGAHLGKGFFGDIGYVSPCPPGKKPHRYMFRVYALDSVLSLPAGATRRQLAAVVKGHVLAEGKIEGLYSRTPEKQK
jgi:Raf kinase inhibitor-like YbhB/YbcL family protein